MSDFDRESMLEMFIFEMSQLVDQLESTIIQSESEYNIDQINEIFRIMHTIKGSSAMMMFDNIAGVAHSIEDLFYYLREENPKDLDFKRLSDHVLSGADFVKAELAKIQEGSKADGDGTDLAKAIDKFLQQIKGITPAEPEAPKQTASAPASVAEPAPAADPTPSTAGDNMHKYRAKIHFQDGCEMENIRSYTLVHNLQEMAQDITHEPQDVIDEETIPLIRQNGFVVDFSSTHDFNFIHSHLSQTVYLREVILEEIGAPVGAASVAPAAAPAPVAEAPPVVADEPVIPVPPTPDIVAAAAAEATQKKGTASHMISVNVSKLDALLNLMGELVISEAMVTQNSELEGLQLESFHKETRQLRKIVTNLQETVMSMRMVPLSATFFKMHRIVRDMCRQLDKDVQLDIVGEETEVDKNIIEHIADPIMHIIRNSIDHGVEMPEDRKKSKKPSKARVLLEAKNSGGDVLVIIKDDGRGINTAKVLAKAKTNGLTTKSDNEYTDKEIMQFIFLPGFSTNDQVTAYSGRGVGMDVVMSNLEVVGGTALVDSTPGEGTTFTLKIPLTLTIQEGMSVLVAGAQYTIPIANIIKSFKAKPENLFTDPSGNEMITERGEILNIVRLHEFFNIDGAVTDVCEGTLIMLENGEHVVCLLVDDLIGQQQAVVKPMPKYFKKVHGLSGCTLLGNGDISLIIDVAGFFDK
ncbi:MAG: chemotaxis protein CheA [Defluviitaleaceae bacterium]|nr:chemotaxis protein CheA [Defluviitaleaceae bacterium]MCL2262170.1 chemotaxis protein CheA [Defluviitaleaceae bacterium]